MKNLIKLLTLILFLNLQSLSLQAQSEDFRYKIQMTTMHNDTTVVTDINSINLSLPRYADYDTYAKKRPKTVKSNAFEGKSGSIYLYLDLKSSDSQLLNIISNPKLQIEGYVTIKDIQDKYPTRIIKFKQATVDSYTEQFASMAYTDAYGTISLVLNCKELIINDVRMEP